MINALIEVGGIQSHGVIKNKRAIENEVYRAVGFCLLKKWRINIELPVARKKALNFFYKVSHLFLSFYH
jgi:hypothetical protein